MKYVEYQSEGNTVGLEMDIVSFWEIDDDGCVVRSVDLQPDGTLLKYDQDNQADHLGQLPEGTITDANLADPRYGVCTVIAREAFESAWQADSLN